MNSKLVIFLCVIAFGNVAADIYYVSQHFRRPVTRVGPAMQMKEVVSFDNFEDTDFDTETDGGSTISPGPVVSGSSTATTTKLPSGTKVPSASIHASATASSSKNPSQTQSPSKGSSHSPTTSPSKGSLPSASATTSKGASHSPTASRSKGSLPSASVTTSKGASHSPTASPSKGSSASVTPSAGSSPSPTASPSKDSPPSASVTPSAGSSPSPTASPSTGSLPSASVTPSQGSSSSPSPSSSVQSASPSMSATRAQSPTPVPTPDQSGCTCGEHAYCTSASDHASCACVDNFELENNACVPMKSATGHLGFEGKTEVLDNDGFKNNLKEQLAKLSGADSSNIKVSISQKNKANQVNVAFSIFITSNSGLSLSSVLNSLSDTSALLAAVNQALQNSGLPTVSSIEITFDPSASPTPSITSSPSPSLSVSRIVKSEAENASLSDGEVAAIVVCSVVGAVAIVVVAVFVQRKKNGNSLAMPFSRRAHSQVTTVPALPVDHDDDDRTGKHPLNARL